MTETTYVLNPVNGSANFYMSTEDAVIIVEGEMLTINGEKMLLNILTNSLILAWKWWLKKPKKVN